MAVGKSDIHQSMSSVKWSTLPLAVAGLLASGCVDPKRDYDDWLARTADARSVVVTFEAGVSDAGAPETAFEKTYLMACLSALSAGNAGEALLFKADAKFTPASGTGGGTFDFTQTPLVAHAHDITQAAPNGMAVTVNGSPVAADGTASVHIGPTTIPMEADPIGADIVFTDSTLLFHVSEDALCAGLSGHVSEPVVSDLDPAQNFCIFRPSTSPFPAFQASDFHCP
jgi:hypothetical protein